MPRTNPLAYFGGDSMRKQKSFNAFIPVKEKKMM
jgi:hypothetical protein